MRIRLTCFRHYLQTVHVIDNERNSRTRKLRETEKTQSCSTAPDNCLMNIKGNKIIHGVIFHFHISLS